MEESVQSRTIATVSSSGKSYYVKRKGIKPQLSKQAKQFFTSPNYRQQQFQTPTYDNSSGRLATLEDSIISSKNQIHLNRFMTINPRDQVNSTSDLISLTESHQNETPANAKISFIKKLNSVSSFMESVEKKRVQKKYVFETVCDQSFNKLLVKKQILIEDPDTTNPQTFNFLPQITKSNTSTHKNAILVSMMSRSRLSRNSSKFSEHSSFQSIHRDIKYKLSNQKLKDYRKLWILKERKRKEINQENKFTQKSPIAEFHASLLQKSINKSKIITEHNNQDVQLRKSKCHWEEELRGQQKKYATIGQTSSSVPGLKGAGQNPSINIGLRPIFNPKKYFPCQQVYKSHKSNLKST